MERVLVVVVGGGQAGLAVSCELTGRAASTPFSSVAASAGPGGTIDGIRYRRTGLLS